MLYLWAALVIFITAVHGIPNVTVFAKGEAGYFCIKIPTLVTAMNGSLIAYGEARLKNCHDSTATDLVMKRSYDNGATWTQLSILYGNSTNATVTVVGNAAPVVDVHGASGVKGRLVVVFCVNNRQVWQMHSDDNGESYTPPRHVASAVKSDWKWVGTGPPAGLQLSSGRLVVPSYHTTIIHGDGNLAVGHIMFSDDGGGAWSLSQDWGALEFASECQAAEIGPNHLLLNSRSSRPHRVQVESLDGGETFGPVRMSSLKEPITGCEGSMVTFSTFKICSLSFDSDSLVTDGSLWYAGPDTSGYFREKMTLFRSTDNGTNWKVHSVFDPGPSAYSALAQLPGQGLVCLWETSHTNQLVFIPDAIVFARLDHNF